MRRALLAAVVLAAVLVVMPASPAAADTGERIAHDVDPCQGRSVGGTSEAPWYLDCGEAGEVLHTPNGDILLKVGKYQSWTDSLDMFSATASTMTMPGYVCARMQHVDTPHATWTTRHGGLFDVTGHALGDRWSECKSATNLAVHDPNVTTNAVALTEISFLGTFSTDPYQRSKALYVWWQTAAPANGDTPSEPLPPPPPADTRPPSIACGRTMRDMGGGQWFADLDAIETFDPLVGGTRQQFWTILNGDTMAAVHSFGGDALTNDGSPKRTWALPLDQATWPSRGYLAVRTAAHIPGADHSFSDPAVTPANGGWYTAGGRWYYVAKAARSVASQVLNTFGVPMTEADLDTAITKLTGYEWQRSDDTTDAPADPTSSAWVYGDEEMADVHELVARCFVRLDPREPEKGSSGDTTTGGGSASDDAADNVPGQSGDDCNVLGGAAKWVKRVPLIGGLASDAVNLVGSLGCVLKWLFLPDSLPWSDLWDEAKVKFPFSVGDEIGGALTRIHDAMSANKDAGDACGVIDLRSVMRSGAPEVVGTKVDNVIYRLPTPQESGCPSFRNSGVREGWENILGDLLGFREVVRGAAALFLYVGFMLAVIRAFVDDDSKALEPS